MKVNLIEKGEGDIDEDGYYVGRATASSAYNGSNDLVNLEEPELTISNYRIIDPTSNKITDKRVSDLTTVTISETDHSSINALPTTGTTYPLKNWFFRGHYGSHTGTAAFNAASSGYDGLQLAWDKSTVGNTATEEDIVPHLKFYLQVQTNFTNVAHGDNITYGHDLMKGLIGLDQNFSTTIQVVQGEGGSCTNLLLITGASTGDFWFTQATSGTLSFYGVTDKVNASASLSNLATTKFPMISFIRYTGETGFGAGSGGGGGGDGTGSISLASNDSNVSNMIAGTAQTMTTTTYSFNGNVGIGTTNPLCASHIERPLPISSYPMAIPSANSTSFGIGVHQFLSSRYTDGNFNQYGLVMGTDGTSYYLQHMSTNHNNYYKLSLNPKGGNVGIGTTSPFGKLDIKHSNWTQTPTASTMCDMLNLMVSSPSTTGENNMRTLLCFADGYRNDSATKDSYRVRCRMSGAGFDMIWNSSATETIGANTTNNNFIFARDYTAFMNKKVGIGGLPNYSIGGNHKLQIVSNGGGGGSDGGLVLVNTGYSDCMYIRRNDAVGNYSSKLMKQVIIQVKYVYNPMVEM